MDLTGRNQDLTDLSQNLTVVSQKLTVKGRLTVPSQNLTFQGRDLTVQCRDLAVPSPNLTGLKIHLGLAFLFENLQKFLILNWETSELDRKSVTSLKLKF